MSRSDTFWAQVERGGPDCCWPWSGSVNHRGYGQFSFAGAKMQAHRAAYELACGDIHKGMFVCHRCDNPPCCNPDHLFLGDHTANMRDMIAKGRHNHKSKTHCVHGHPFDERNTRIDSTGVRHCRACAVARQQRRRQRQDAPNINHLPHDRKDSKKGVSRG